MNNKTMQMIIYHIDDTDMFVNAIVKDDTIWVTQKAMAELFAVNVPATSI